MTTSEFINKFKTGKLGKKRQHASYRVMDGQHCQLLVRATKRYGMPGGSELIGIYFGDGIVLFHKNFSGLRYSVTDQVDSPKPVLTDKVLKENDEHLIDSGIIEVDDERGLMLVEIGDTPWLFEQDPKFKPNRYSGWDWSYNTGVQLSKRVETVEEAIQNTILPPDQISQLGRLLKVMPSDFVPVATSEADKKLLMNPPNPFDYGFGLNDLVTSSGYSTAGQGCKPLYLKNKLFNSGTGFKTAVQAYNDAVKRFTNIEPDFWEKLTITKTGDNPGTIIIGENEQVYIKGHVYLRNNSSEVGDFMTWHQVLGESSKIRLPVR